MRVFAFAGLCCLTILSGCKSFSWSPSEWFSASAAPAAASSTIAAPAAQPARDSGLLAETGPGETMKLGRPISTVQPGHLQPGRPGVQEPCYLPHTTPGPVPQPSGRVQFRAPSRDSVTMDVPLTERPAATTASEVAPRVGMDASEQASGGSPRADEQATDDDGESSRWKSAWHGWEAAVPTEGAEKRAEPDIAVPLASAGEVRPLDIAPRKASEVVEESATPPKPAESNSAAPRTLPQQPIVIQNRPL